MKAKALIIPRENEFSGFLRNSFYLFFMPISFDKWLLAGVLVLLFFGVWMMSWVSVFNSSEKEKNAVARQYCQQEIANFSLLTPAEQRACVTSEAAQETASLYCEYNNCNDRFLVLHVRNIIIALVAMFLVFLIPFEFWRLVAPIAFVVCIILLITVLIMPAQGGFTSKSWLQVPVIGLFQPAEAMKLALTLYAALWMEKKKSQMSTWSDGFVPFALLVIIIVGLLVLQPDFGSTAILLIIASAIFWVAGGHWVHFIVAGAGGAILGFFAYSSFEYVQRRFDTFLNPELASSQDKYQIEQSFLSIGNGGLIGANDSSQSFGFLPEIQGDMIFAAIAEKIGFIGTLLVVMLYAFIFLRGIAITQKAPDRFSMLVAAGITAWFATQSLVNMMVVTGLFPLTGITLPLLSFGGSSLLISLTALGILLKISTLTPFSHEATANRRRKRRASVSAFLRR